ncbi:MAG: DUF86 domain-containing protein [Acidobacteriota bacterium]
MKSDRTYLLHIRDSIARIEQYASVGREQFFTTPHWQDAIIRQLEIIGEATKHLSPGLREANHDTPWRRIGGLRDVLIHHYMGVDLEAIWSVVEYGIPSLRMDIERILSEHG